MYRRKPAPVISHRQRGCYCYHWSGLVVFAGLYRCARGHGKLITVAMLVLWTQRSPLAALGWPFVVRPHSVDKIIMPGGLGAVSGTDIQRAPKSTHALGSVEKTYLHSNAVYAMCSMCAYTKIRRICQCVVSEMWWCWVTFGVLLYPGAVRCRWSPCSQWVWYGMVDVCDGCLAAASGPSFG